MFSGSFVYPIPFRSGIPKRTPAFFFVGAGHASRLSAISFLTSQFQNRSNANAFQLAAAVGDVHSYNNFGREKLRAWVQPALQVSM